MPLHLRKNTRKSTGRQAAYSLVELTLASGILAAGVAAAASLTLTSARLEEITHRKARVLALTEGAARLWQLGLNESEIKALVPGDPALASLDFSPAPATTATGTLNPGESTPRPLHELGAFEAATLNASLHADQTPSPDSPTQPLRPLLLFR